MLVIISPAKTLDYESPLATERFTQPELLDKSKQLIKICRELTPVQISKLMGISDKLAGLNAARFGDWQPKFTRTMLARPCWLSKATSIPVCTHRTSARAILTSPSSTCACCPGCTACCARSI